MIRWCAPPAFGAVNRGLQRLPVSRKANPVNAWAIDRSGFEIGKGSFIGCARGMQKTVRVSQRGRMIALRAEQGVVRRAVFAGVEISRDDDAALPGEFSDATSQRARQASVYRLGRAREENKATSAERPAKSELQTSDCLRG
jgi:hypothetical protein